MAKNYGYLILFDTHVYAMEKDDITIGRGADCDLLLDDPRVSRVHARLTFSNGNALLNDLNSSGGTDVNGRPIVQKLLTPGDVITLAGQVSLVFRASAEDLPAGWTAYEPPIARLDPTVNTGSLDPSSLPKKD